ncbi:hypothetical protein THRCLA_21912, partial [Thraustotheca clavata]
KYSTNINKQCLKAKLTDEWVVQMNAESGQKYYFNLRKATTQTAHPNILSAHFLLTLTKVDTYSFSR